MLHLEAQTLELYVVVVGGLTAAVLLALLVRGLVRDRRVRAPPLPPPQAEPAPVLPDPPAMNAADIHMKCTLLAEQNPVLAGQMKLAELLKLHGK